MALKVKIIKDIPFNGVGGLDVSKTQVVVVPNTNIYDAQVNADKNEVKQLTQEVRDAHSHIHADHECIHEDKADVQARQADVIERQANVVSLEAATLASKNAAKVSETNAKSSETKAKASEVAAKTSETNADASEAGALASKNAAKVSETNSKASEVAAKSSETKAKTSETNAKASETNAAASKSSAAASASTATTKATEAATSASKALASQNAAKTSETNAGASEAGALASKNAAKVSETNAKSSETKAKASEVAADASEAAALVSQNAAKVSETNAASSKAAALVSQNAAKVSETNSKASEASALASKNAAKTSETNALASKNSAASSASTATTQAGVASNHAAAALASKNAAKASETNAAESASRAEVAAASLTGALVEMGSCDLSGGVYPAPKTDANGNKRACFWKVVKGGTVSGAEYGAGDTLVYSEEMDAYYKIDNTESVTSVNGKKGVVTLSAADVKALAITGGTVTGNTTLQGRVNINSNSLHVAGVDMFGVNSELVRVGDGSLTRTLTLNAKDHMVVVNNGKNTQRIYHQGWKPRWGDVEGNDYFTAHDHLSIKASKNLLFDHNVSTVVRPLIASSGKVNLGDSSGLWNEVWANKYRGGAVNVTGNGIFGKLQLTGDTGGLASTFFGTKTSLIRLGGSSAAPVVVTGNHESESYTYSKNNPRVQIKNGALETFYHTGFKPTLNELTGIAANSQLLDGKDSGEFARNGVIPDGSSGLNQKTSGMYRLGHTISDPPPDFSHGYGQMIVSRGLTSDTTLQILSGYNNKDIAWRSFSDNAAGQGAITWNKFYHEGNKPTWNDVNGNYYFGEQSTGHIKVAQGKNLYLADDKSLLPSVKTSTAVSMLGQSDRMFKEAWVNSYRGATAELSGRINAEGGFYSKNGSGIIPQSNNEIGFSSTTGNIYLNYRKNSGETITTFNFGNGTGTAGSRNGNIRAGHGDFLSMVTPDAHFNTAAGLGTRFGSTPHKALVGTSSHFGEYVFGGSKTGALSFDDYVRVGTNKLQYTTDGKTFNVYHTGNKPTAADVGAVALNATSINIGMCTLRTVGNVVEFLV
ncbi:hypothetical protein L4D00_14915 [Photobacterium swingsii]|uniref:hypothetical protein n=1 Tax=Photobacterium swingsii TaxID=680026 RepID=UPI003D09DEAF